MKAMHRNKVDILLTFLFVLMFGAFVNAQDSTMIDNPSNPTTTNPTTTSPTSTNPTTTPYNINTRMDTSTIIQQSDAGYRENSDRWARTLADRLSLNSVQRDSIGAILIDYQRQRTILSSQNMTDTQIDQFNNVYNTKIQGLLQGDQLTNYNNYSSTWWTGINSSVSTGNSNQNKSK